MDHSNLDKFATTDFEQLVIRLYRTRMEKEIEDGTTIHFYKKGYSAEDISDLVELPLEQVVTTIGNYLKFKSLKSEPLKS
jgi:hypothetical protein